MAYFSDLLKQFGDVAPALAAYNAGEHRVVRWLAERPGIDRDEFIDDIPFPETQNYVKRIIGTAEDYRLLVSAQSSATPAGVRAIVRPLRSLPHGVDVAATHLPESVAVHRVGHPRDDAPRATSTAPSTCRRAFPTFPRPRRSRTPRARRSAATSISTR